MARRGEPIWADVQYEWVEIRSGSGTGFWHPVDLTADFYWMEDQIRNQPKEPGRIKGRIISFPIADGYAHYRVEKLSPLTLRPFMVGDMWEIPDAHMRGLTKADVGRMIEWDDRLSEFFRTGQ